MTNASPHNTKRTGHWVNLAKLPHHRQEHGTVPIDDNTIALIGGVFRLGDGDVQEGLLTTDVVEVYDIPSDTWKTKAPTPYKVNHPNVATVNGKIYLLGGLVDAQDPPLPYPDWIPSGECHVYDTVKDVWSPLEPMEKGTERGSAILGVHGEMIYVAGGMTFLIPDDQDSLTTVTAFNTTSGKWQKLPDIASNIPEGRQHGVGAVVGHNFYVVGGRYMKKQNVRGTVFILDLNNQQAGWKISEGEMPVPRGGLSGAVLGKKFYTFGGEANPNATDGIFNETEVFDITTEKWSQKKAMAVPRHGLSAVAIGNKVYLPGGGLQEDGLSVWVDGKEHLLRTTDHFDAYVV
ncbi:galactose oxidase [Lindgomyces ingoldianus]|uniref:Galactose oxidase n=1 Tax=Lindgomyces ingoldianus TaxID=673940 RepID=A0ACB6Q749_9PLEO|nr:galactose oxidase [Lindgomyces ingoldianus]KAF2462602.1 galactose oxidase [Lindgomyces ingoldianus]